MRLRPIPVVLYAACSLSVIACGGESKPAESPPPAQPAAEEESEPPVDATDDVTDEIGNALSGEEDNTDTEPTEDEDY